MKRKSTLLMALLLLWIVVVPNSTWGAGGDLLWEKTITFSPTYPYISSSSLAVSSTLCIVYGSVQTQFMPPMVLIGYIKAYDMATGNLKWERTLTLGNYYNGFGKIIIDGNIAYITGSSSSTSGTPPTPYWQQYTLGAYDANTGQTLWENISADSIGNLNMYVPAPLVNNRIITSGYNNSDSSNGYISLKVYQARDVTPPAINGLLLFDK